MHPNDGTLITMLSLLNLEMRMKIQVACARIALSDADQTGETILQCLNNYSGCIANLLC